MTSQINEYEIVQGPDRLAILMAYAHYGKHAQRVPADAVLGSHDIVFFVSKDVLVKYPGSKNPNRLEEVEFYMTVTGIQHEDHTGTSWNIEGRLMGASPQPHHLEFDSEKPGRRVLVRYSTNKKEGQLKVFID